MEGWKKHFWEREYFYDKDMVRDSHVSVAGNCFDQLAAIILKNTTDWIEDYDYIGLEDISIHVLFDKEGYLVRSALKCNDTGYDKNLWHVNRQVIIGDKRKAQAELENVLNTKGYAIIRTADTMLEFSRYYKNDGGKFDYQHFSEAGHVFLIVGMDEGNYYYVDQTSELRLDKYIPSVDRRDIGVYPKESFLEVFAYYLGIFTIDFHWDNLKKLTGLCAQIVHQSVRNYYSDYISRMTDGITVYGKGGRAALSYIKDMIEAGKAVLGRPVYQPSTDRISNMRVADELLNGITGIVNRREVLKEYFLKNEINVIEVEHTLCLWKKWKTVIIDRYTQGGEVLTGKDFDFNKIVDSEENLFRKLSSLQWV